MVNWMGSDFKNFRIDLKEIRSFAFAQDGSLVKINLKIEINNRTSRFQF